MDARIPWWKLAAAFLAGVTAIGVPASVLFDLRFGQWNPFLHNAAWVLLVVPGFTMAECLFPRSRRTRRAVAIAHSLVAISLWGSCALVARAAVLRGSQVRTFADMQVVVLLLHRHFEANGSFPPSLSDALSQPVASHLGTDAWGNPLWYQARSSAFVLVSFGRDGKPDFADYWEVRDTAPTFDQDHEAADVSGIFNADQVVTDRGWHRSAGK